MIFFHFSTFNNEFIQMQIMQDVCFKSPLLLYFNTVYTVRYYTYIIQNNYHYANDKHNHKHFKSHCMQKYFILQYFYNNPAFAMRETYI